MSNMSSKSNNWLIWHRRDKQTAIEFDFVLFYSCVPCVNTHSIWWKFFFSFSLVHNLRKQNNAQIWIFLAKPGERFFFFLSLSPHSILYSSAPKINERERFEYVHSSWLFFLFPNFNIYVSSFSKACVCVCVFSDIDYLVECFVRACGKIATINK